MAAQNIPEWLNADFLKSCLENDDETHQGIVINSYTCEPAVPAGNNYGSLMLRVKIQYRKLKENDQCTISLIIKSPLIGGFMEGIEDCLEEIYGREPKFYNDFINQTYKLCKHNIVPKHYKSPNPLCVVLEDLNTSRYVMVSRHDLLDFDHCQLYIKSSSKLHALSIAVHKTHPQLIESVPNLPPDIAERDDNILKAMMIGGLRCMAVYLEDKPEYKEYLKILKEASENEILWTLYKEAEKVDKPLKALIQNDPWCTNMMFKYNNAGKVEAVKLFDFQSLKFTTPVMEFITFVWSSANADVRKEKINDLYNLYYNSLNKNLLELGCPERLSFEDLKEEIKLLSPLVLTVICGMLPICLADEVADISDYVTGNILKIPAQESSIYSLYQGKAFNRYFPQFLDYAGKEGIFEYIKEIINNHKSMK